MKNITAQYRDLLEGKISKANFMTNVRRLFPDYIGTANNLEDTITILKGKRILSEGNMQPLTEDKMYYLVDEHGDVVDQVEAPDMTAAKNHFENEYEGLITSMTIVPSRPRAMYEDPNTSVEDPGDRAARLAGEDNEEEEYLEFDTVDEVVDAELEAAKEEARKNSEEGYVQHVNKTRWGYSVEDWYDSDNTVASYENGEQINEDTKDIEALRAGALREAVEKPEGSYKKVTGKEQYSVFSEIDRVNPYELRKGITIEMGMQYMPTPNYFTTHFNPEALAKATKKVLKNLQKDPAFYTNQISMTTEKRTNMLQKPKELKVGADGEAKIKGFTDAKSNTETNLGKKEKGSKSPEGVKEMKPSKKSMGGIKIMKTNEKLPKGVELMKEDFRPGVNMGSAFNKFKQDIIGNKEDFELADENAFEDLVKKYDWYAEMSDDSRKWDAQQIVDRKLEDLGKKIGIQRAVELFNQYAPKDRKITASFFSIREDKLAKLKEYLKAEVRKMLQEEDPALTKLKKDEENAEKALATVLTKKAAILNKPGTQG